MIQQSKINSFINSIADTAEEKRKKVFSQTEEILKAEKEKIEEDAKKAANDYIKAKTASIKLEAGKRISESAAQCRKEVFSRRNEIAMQIRSEVAEKLSDFTRSEEYRIFLEKSAAKVMENFGASNVTLLFRAEDVALGEKICRKYPNARASEDPTIQIGGIKGIDSVMMLLVDDTLDSRLNSQKKWFEENSGLYIGTTSKGTGYGS